MTKRSNLSRRRFLGTGVAATGIALAAPQIARAADYPERNISVIIPTREGGGADRNFRAFTSIWKTKLGTDFEPGFFPGASGRVGYEVYMGKNKPDAYSLIFGNMGPEVLNWAIQAPTFDVNDYFYFGQVDKDPGCLFVGAESPLKTLDDVIAEGKKRKLNVGTSRMAHPASIGLLALGEATGAQFNLIALSITQAAACSRCCSAQLFDQRSRYSMVWLDACSRSRRLARPRTTQRVASYYSLTHPLHRHFATAHAAI